MFNKVTQNKENLCKIFKLADEFCTKSMNQICVKKTLSTPVLRDTNEILDYLDNILRFEIKYQFLLNLSFNSFKKTYKN